MLTKTRIVFVFVLALLTFLPLAHATSATVVTAAHSSNEIVWDDYQEDSCFATGNYYVFLNNGTGVFAYTASSITGIWSAHKIPINPSSVMPLDFVFHCIGNTVYYVYGDGGPYFAYRYGTLNSNATITWVIPETLVSTPTNVAAGTSIILDSNGDIVVSVETTIATALVYEYTTAWNLIDTISVLGNTASIPSELFSLSNGNIALTFSPGGYGSPLSITLYNGSAWTAPQTTNGDATGRPTFARSSGIAVGDTVFEGENLGATSCALVSSTNGGPWIIRDYVTALEADTDCTIQSDINSGGLDLVMFMVSYNQNDTQYVVTSNLGGAWGAETRIARQPGAVYPAAGDYSNGCSVTCSSDVFFASWTTQFSPPFLIQMGFVNTTETVYSTGFDGVVVNATTHSPISGAAVNFYDDHGHLIGTTTTNPNGVYSLQHRLPTKPTEYTVSATYNGKSQTQNLLLSPIVTWATGYYTL